MPDKVELLSHAKHMRYAATEAEAALWRHLRAGRLADHKFKRQQPIGSFIVDFVCFAQKLVIELDGGQHVDQQVRDDARTAWLQSRGFRVLRFWNDDMLQRRNLVLEEILCVLEEQKREKHKAPDYLSPCGRGRRACASGEG